MILICFHCSPKPACFLQHDGSLYLPSRLSDRIVVIVKQMYDSQSLSLRVLSFAPSGQPCPAWLISPIHLCLPQQCIIAHTRDPVSHQWWVDGSSARRSQECSCIPMMRQSVIGQHVAVDEALTTFVQVMVKPEYFQRRAMECGNIEITCFYDPTPRNACKRLKQDRCLSVRSRKTSSTASTNLRDQYTPVL